MSKVEIKSRYLSQFAQLDDSIKQLNHEKIRLLFEMLGIRLLEKDLPAILDWELILVSVPDRQMAIQLNKLSASVPNLKFLADADQELFAVSQGEKG